MRRHPTLLCPSVRNSRVRTRARTGLLACLFSLLAASTLSITGTNMVSIGGATSQFEGNPGDPVNTLVFPISIQQTPHSGFELFYVANNPSGQPAPGADYSAADVPSSIQVPPNVQTAEVVVHITQDLIDESDEVLGA